MKRSEAAIKDAADHLERMMGDAYAGKSVRNPVEFKADLEALRIGFEVLRDVLTDYPKYNPVEYNAGDE